MNGNGEDQASTEVLASGVRRCGFIRTVFVFTCTCVCVRAFMYASVFLFRRHKVNTQLPFPFPHSMSFARSLFSYHLVKHRSITNTSKSRSSVPNQLKRSPCNIQSHPKHTRTHKPTPRHFHFWFWCCFCLRSHRVCDTVARFLCSRVYAYYVSAEHVCFHVFLGRFSAAIRFFFAGVGAFRIKLVTPVQCNWPSIWYALSTLHRLFCWYVKQVRNHVRSHNSREIRNANKLADKQKKVATNINKTVQRKTTTVSFAMWCFVVVFFYPGLSVK